MLKLQIDVSTTVRARDSGFTSKILCSGARRHQNTAKFPKPAIRKLASNGASPESRDPVHGSLHTTTDTESISSQVPETHSASDTSWSKSGSVEMLPTISRVAGSSSESMRPKGYHSRDERCFLLLPLPCFLCTMFARTMNQTFCIECHQSRPFVFLKTNCKPPM